MNKIPLVSLGLGLLLIFVFHNAFASDYAIDGAGSMCVASSQSCPAGFLLNEANRCIKADLWCKNEFDYNSFFNTETTACECIDDYFEQDGQCIAGGPYCREIYGTNAKYYAFTNNCGCNSGYIFFNDQCMIGSEYCRSRHGEFARLADGGCSCQDGYILGKRIKSLRSCIPREAICKQNYGPNAEGDPKNCQCKAGTEWNEDHTRCLNKNDLNLDKRYDYLKLRKDIACKDLNWSDARCFWSRIDLAYAEEILEKEDITVTITAQDIKRLSQKMPILESRYRVLCVENQTSAKYCSALNKLIERGEHFLYTQLPAYTPLQ